LGWRVNRETSLLFYPASRDPISSGGTGFKLQTRAKPFLNLKCFPSRELRTLVTIGVQFVGGKILNSQFDMARILYNSQEDESVEGLHITGWVLNMDIPTWEVAHYLEFDTYRINIANAAQYLDLDPSRWGAARRITCIPMFYSWYIGAMVAIELPDGRYERCGWIDIDLNTNGRTCRNLIILAGGQTR
jgi:hypothetical protein